jgi:NTP pyrophosphatase (non-canonical NTP hydrolase)
MDIKLYQEFAKTTVKYPKEFRIIYPMLGLIGEVGEVAEKLKKWLRDDDFKEFGKPGHPRWLELEKEMGDVAWYFSALCSDLFMDADKVLQKNIIKLKSRQERDKIHGDGDDR